MTTTNLGRHGFADTRHGQAHYVEQGHGFPVLLLHQTPRSWDEYRDVIPILGESFHVIAMDTMGFGSSARPPMPWSVEMFAESAIDLCDALGLGRVSIVGHHTGAVVAVEIAAAHPDRIEALVLSGMPFVDAARRRIVADRAPIDHVVPKADGSHLERLWNNRAPYYPSDRPDLLDRLVHDATGVLDSVEEGHLAVNRYLMEERIGLITAPTLVLCGELDTFSLPDQPAITAALTGARSDVLPGTGVPAVDHKPEQFASAVRGFLAGPALPAAATSQHTTPRETEMDIRSRSLTMDGTTLSYHVSRSAAAGVPTVFLHPWFGCWQFWISTMDGLADRPCFAVDFYSPAGGDWSSVDGPSGLADAVLHMLDSEGLDQVDLVGNSVGGIVAQIIASTAPDRVRRLVLVGTGANTAGALPAFAETVDRWTAGVGDNGGPSREAIADTVGMLFTCRPEPEAWETYVQAVSDTNAAYMGSVLNAARRLDLTPDLPRITAPTLILRGTEDCARTAAHAAALAEGIPVAHAIEMDGAGHSPMIDHPDEFLRLVTEHLDSEFAVPYAESNG
ncbi:alpha/beta fold hydrolase [Rhodococcus artemisiae]|uniref:Alpha/beta hydrolase n=1 Tax=Rhodococcus artemisiae TaxID=714159 RepID=A0ABU7LFK8_9NOCA|nr:alpha/beta hydrolase [Rhodococcus artemisiae]MEE2060318.1 alpha/beta hydrolase [Rhodococcus artemisiae]